MFGYALIESLRYWLPLATIFWLLGYFATRLVADDQYVRVPTWFFYFCGLPRINGINKGLITRMGAGLQIIAFFQLVFALFFDFLFQDKELSKIVGILTSLICSLIITRILASNSS